MCDERRERTDAPGQPRVRWNRLYGILAVMAGALTSIEAFGPAGSAAMALRGGIALAAFVAMALWIRGNRAAFDYADWCECAAGKITVRVIPSRRPEPERPPLADEELERVVGGGRVAKPEREIVLTWASAGAPSPAKGRSSRPARPGAPSRTLRPTAPDRTPGARTASGSPSPRRQTGSRK